MKYYVFFAATLIFTGFPDVGAGQSVSPAPTDDTQFWSDVQVSVPLNKKVDLNLTGTFRLGRGLSHPVSERGAISIAYKPHKFLTVETGYQYVANQPSERRKNYSSNLIFVGTVKLPVGKFTVSDRNQIERRLRNSRIDSTRYRNRLRVEHPFVAAKTKFNVFVSNEVFYEWILNKWARNRFAVGANKKLTERLTGEMYYMRQNDGLSRPGDLHVIGTLFKVQL